MIKGTSDLSKLLKGVSFSWIRFVLTIAIGIFQTPLLFHNLSKQQLDFWYIFYSFGAFLQLADLGLVQTISRLIAYIENSDHSTSSEKTIGTLSNYSPKQIYVTALLSFVSILVFIGLVAFCCYVFVYEQNTNDKTLRISFLIYIIGVIFNLLSNVPAAMLIGYRDVGADSLIRSATQILYFLLLYLLLPHYQSVLLVSFGFMFQNLVQLVGLHLTLNKRHAYAFIDVNPQAKLIDFSIAKQIYSQSFPLVINQLGGWLISQGNVLIASIVVGADRISDYSINQQLFTYITAIALVLNQAMGPFIAKQYIKNKLDGLQSLFLNTMVICLSIVGLLLIVIISCGSNILGIWVGTTHFLGNSFTIIFGLITFLEVQHSVAGNFVWNTGSWPFNRWTFFAGLLSVVLGYLLGKNFGLVGIATATLIAKLLTLNWYVVYVALKRLNLKVKSYIGNTLAPLIVSVVIALFVAIYIRHYAMLENLSDLAVLFLVATISGIVFLALVGFLFRKSFIVLYETLLLPKLKTKL